MLDLRQAIRQGLECPLAGAHAGCQPDPLQYGRGRDEHVGSAQMGEHGLDDRLAAIRGPCRVRAQLQTGSPVGPPEAAQAQELLQLNGVLSPGLVPKRVP